MKNTFLILYFSLFYFFSPAQNLQKISQEITNEGIQLYRSEMASWYGTDVFIENYKERNNIGGYFSYIHNNEVPTCVFFSKENKVIGTISFPTDYNPKNSKLDLSEREFSEVEKEYFIIRQEAIQKIENDTIFKYYKDVKFNLVPVISKDGRKKVYIFSGTNKKNTILFGNDYLLDFDKQNKIKKIHKLHNSLLMFSMYDKEVGDITGGIHSHVIEDWPYITPTDICTLMLYQNYTNWNQYTVVSKKYTSIWNCKSYHLTILKNSTLEKINIDQSKKE